MKVSNIFPSNVEIKHDYIKVNNKYIASIIIHELPRQIYMLEIMKMIPKNIENITSMYINKKDVNDEIRKLSKVILESSSEIKAANNNLISKDVAKKINTEALELRRKLQLEGEDIYGVSVFISISNTNLDELKLDVNKIISNLYANNIFAKVANFRQDVVYLNTLPIKNIDNQIASKTDINITTAQNAYLIPYIRNDIYDENGILYGYINNSFCIYDIFSENNMNHNACVLGSSGAGKSFFIKTIILRNFCMNIRQIIFDIEEEYLNISDKTNTIEFNASNFNIMYITKEFAESNLDNFIDMKIKNIIYDLSIIIGDKINEYEKILSEEIKKVYLKFGINSDINSLYEGGINKTINVNKWYKKYSTFPNIRDLLLQLEENKQLEKDIIKDIKNVWLYKKYNIEEAKKLDEKFDMIIVFNMKSLPINNFPLYINYAQEYYTSKLLIYIDEVWKFMEEEGRQNISKKIAELYKTIRKKNAGIVIISQDIHEILKYENGTFGKSILNNSFTKLFFKMQYLDTAILSEIGICSDDILSGIKKLLKGRAYMCIGDNNFNIDIKASEFEKEIIGGEPFEKGFSSN